MLGYTHHRDVRPIHGQTRSPANVDVANSRSRATALCITTEVLCQPINVGVSARG